MSCLLYLGELMLVPPRSAAECCCRMHRFPWTVWRFVWRHLLAQPSGESVYRRRSIWHMLSVPFHHLWLGFCGIRLLKWDPVDTKDVMSAKLSRSNPSW